MDVSVIIPLFNSENVVEKAVQSALSQNEVKEIILIDDGSEDTTQLICENIVRQNEKIKYFRQPYGVNLGAGPARNLGILKAECEFIAFLDSDDEYLENRFKQEKLLFSGHDNVDFILNCVENILSEKHQFFKQFITLNKEIDKKTFYKSLIGLHKWLGDFHLNGITLKKQFITDNQIYFSDKLRLHQDTLFLIQIVYYGDFRFGSLTCPVAIRNIHDHNRISEVYKSKKIKNKKKLLFLKELKEWAIQKKVGYSDNIRIQYYLNAAYTKPYNIINWLLLFFFVITYKIKKLKLA